MEREIERERERERDDMIYYNYERKFVQMKEESDRIALLPRVIKPALFGRNGYALGTPRVEDRLTVAPVNAITCSFVHLQPGQSTEPVRGVPSGLFYMLEGKGKSVQDGAPYTFEQGDLVVVPTYTQHQLIADTATQVRAWAPEVRFWHLMGLLRHELENIPAIPPEAEPFQEGGRQGFRIRTELSRREQEVEVYLGANARLQEFFTSRRKSRQGSTGQTKYDYFLQLLERENAELQTLPRVLRAGDLAWEDTVFGRMKYFMDYWTPALARGLDVFVLQLPPGGRSGKHRHFGEELLLVTKGRGYDIHDGVRHDWAKGDLIAVPSAAVHQHFNAVSEPAELVSVVLQQAANLNMDGLEHMEDAPAPTAV
jgi:quercetin dioxygenase-like cupin family protein